MQPARIPGLLVPIALGITLACARETGDLPLEPQFDRFASSEWSEPINLGPVVNSSANENNAALSPDGHALYFVSNRPGGLGGTDIWVSERQCLACPWEAPVNLGAPINSTANDASPSVSDNGHLLFFFSTRPGGLGGSDIYVSERSPGVDGAWGDPVNLGPDVNTAAFEQGPYYVREGGEPTATLYFNTVPSGGSIDIYRVAIGGNGAPLGPATPVPELNDPTAADQKLTMRADGLELLLSSDRSGSLGGFDLWRSTRRTVQDAWSTPVHLGSPLSTINLDSQPLLSRDGRTLIFASNRPGGSGGNDLWMSTRKPGGP